MLAGKFLSQDLKIMGFGRGLARRGVKRLERLFGCLLGMKTGRRRLTR